MATVNDVLEAFAYYIGHGGYIEKKDGDARYLTRAVENFHKNDGDGNWTYMGTVCGVNPGAWCAMMVSTAVYEGCGSSVSAARKAMWGVWPYTVVTQLWNAADDDHRFYSRYQRFTLGKGDREEYTPREGDVVIFTDDGSTRTHTGMVYAVDSLYIYTYEGNSANMARKRSYSLGSAYIWGYVTLNLEPGEGSMVARFQRWLGVNADGIYGPATQKAAIRAHQAYLNETYGTALAEDGLWGPATYYATRELRRGDDSDDVMIWQGLLYGAGLDPKLLDGEYGERTLAATEAFQTGVGLHPTGNADRYTWARRFDQGRPAHTVLRRGSTGAEVKYLQELLTIAGYAVSADGVFGEKTERAVKSFQEANGLEADGVVGAKTWEALE